LICGELSDRLTINLQNDVSSKNLTIAITIIFIHTEKILHGRYLGYNGTCLYVTLPLVNGSIYIMPFQY